MRGRRALLLLAALCATVGSAHAEWQNFLVGDGLADNDVQAILQEKSGRLWFGTAGGASRYDGIHWSTVRDSLRDPNVIALCQDRTGALWFGTVQGGAVRFDGGRWQRYSAANVLPRNQVTAILEDHAGDLWFGTPGGVTRYRPGRDSSWTTDSTSFVRSFALSITEDHAHTLWVGTPKGVSWLDSTRTRWQTFPAGSPGANELSSDSVLAVAEDRRGSIWFATIQGAFRYADGQWAKFTTESGLASDTVTHIVPDRSGGVWFGGSRGVTHFDGEEWEAFNQTSERRDLGIVDAMYLDSEGNLWIGTRARGLYRYDGVAWHNYFSSNTSTCSRGSSQSAPSDDVLGSNCVQAMLQDHAGDLWFATADGGASRLASSGRWSPLRRGTGVPISDSLETLFEDRAGSLWFGSASAGLARLDSTRTHWQAFTRRDSLASDTVFTLFQDRRGALWVGTATGVSRYEGATWRNSLAGPSQIEVHQVVEDNGDSLWFRTSAGLFRLDATRTGWRRLGVPDLAGDDVAALQRSRDGRIWVGSRQGLAIYDGKRWTVFRSFGALGDSSVQSILEDDAGRIWLSLAMGVARYDGLEWTYYSYLVLESFPLASLFGDDLHTLWLATQGGLRRFNQDTWRKYDRGVGLASDEVNGFLQDRRGRLWFATKQGLTLHEPDRVAPQTTFVSTPAPLTPSRNATIVFGAAYGEAADVEFSYSWDGGDWSSWTSAATWDTTDISDGLHTFAVRARDWSRNVDPTPAVFIFEVDATPPPAVISAPRFNEVVRGRIVFRGSTADPRFRGARLQLRPAGTKSWEDPAVRAIPTPDTAVTNGLLGDLDSTTLPDGRYEVRLSVTDELGLLGTALIEFIIDNQAPSADVTSPRRVPVLEGGDVYTTHAELHLYFPPHSFAQDADVMIVEGDSSTKTTVSLLTRLTPPYDISWSAPRLLKTATLDIAVPDRGKPAEGRSPAIYMSRGDGGWVRLGGTLDPKSLRVSAPLTGPGRYALFLDDGAVGASVGITELRLTPRVFSPTGGFASAGVAISFTLGRPASTTITAYNRAGRQVREVLSGVELGAGANLVRWDGRDADGKAVADGMYVVAVRALGKVEMRTVGVIH